MLRFPCLVLDHDDTVVQSEATVNHPFFCEYLDEHRPGMTISLHDYVSGCFDPGYIPMCRQRFHFTDEELEIEYKAWKEHIRHHAPEAYPGIAEVLRRYKELGGVIIVASQSAQENILRDYRLHIGIEPDEIFGWDLDPEHRKPNPYAIVEAQKKYGFAKEQMLVVDDMKTAVQMARDGGVKIAFAGWGRREFPEICAEMENLCDYSLYSTEDFAKFLFA